jgi:ankyrin repeat protein
MEERRRYIGGKVLIYGNGFPQESAYRVIGSLAIKDRNASLLSRAVERIDNINEPDSSGMTLIAEAASIGDLDMVKILLSLGADPGIKDNTGLNAIDHSTIEGYLGIQEYLESLVESLEMNGHTRLLRR